MSSRILSAPAIAVHSLKECGWPLPWQDDCFWHCRDTGRKSRKTGKRSLLHLGQLFPTCRPLSLIQAASSDPTWGFSSLSQWRGHILKLHSARQLLAEGLHIPLLKRSLHRQSRVQGMRHWRHLHLHSYWKIVPCYSLWNHCSWLWLDLQGVADTPALLENPLYFVLTSDESSKAVHPTVYICIFKQAIVKRRFLKIQLCWWSSSWKNMQQWQYFQTQRIPGL